jgi:ubiquinone/menaquinone biosynthesis C-methylase UbiE
MRCCVSLGLMFFPDPLRGLREFRRVLRAGGRAAVSVTTTPNIREEVRSELADTGGPIEIEMEIRFASGQR